MHHPVYSPGITHWFGHYMVHAKLRKSETKFQMKGKPESACVSPRECRKRIEVCRFCTRIVATAKHPIRSRRTTQ